MSGRRAAYKVARKNALRNRKRTIFLVLLVAVPVALGVVVAGIVRASTYTPEEQAQLQFGTADARVETYSPEVEGGGGGAVDWVYTTVGELSSDLALVDFRQGGITLSDYNYGTITDIDLANPLTEGMYVLLDGRIPTQPDEVAISPDLAELMEVEVGDVVEIEDYDRGGLNVVGLASHPLANSGHLVLVAPGELDGDREYTSGTSILIGGENAESVGNQLNDLWYSEGGRSQFWPEPAVSPKPSELEFLEDELYVFLTEAEIEELVELARTADPAEEDPYVVISERAWEMVYASGGGFVGVPELYAETRSLFLDQPRFEENPALLSTAAAALLLVEVAFITGAAFAAGTRRRLREIGLLGAQGASEKHVKTTVVGEGLTIGMIGSGVGVVLGIAVLVLARPLLQRFVSRLISGPGVSLTDVLGPIAVALVSVLIAVWIPAKTASRVPITTALQGRMPASSPRRWVVPVGLGFSAVGALLITVALASTSNFAGAIVGVGAVLVVGGVAMLASPILAGVTKLSDLVPATGRLVLRDSGRNRTRSAVAVAAIMVILLAPVIFLTMAATDEEKYLIYGLPAPAEHLVVRGDFGDQFDGSAASIDEADVAAVAAIVPEEQIATFSALDVRMKTAEMLQAEERNEPTLGGYDDFAVAVESEGLLSALAHAGVSERVGAGEIVVLGIEDKATRIELNGVEYPAQEYAVPVVQWAMPRIILPELVAAEYSDAESRMMALFILERPLNEQEQREMWGTLHLEIQGGSSSLSQSAVYGIAVGVTLVVVLIVVSLVTAVSAAEVDEEVRTIVAVGAAGSYRRRFLGLLTGYQTLVAVALSVPLGLGLVKVFSSANDYDQPGIFGSVHSSLVVIPWWQIGAFALAIPVVIGLLTLGSVRSASVTPPRRAT